VKFAKTWDSFSLPALLQEIFWQTKENHNWNVIKHLAQSSNYLHRWAIVTYLRKTVSRRDNKKNFSKAMSFVGTLCHDPHRLVAAEARWLLEKYKFEQRYDTEMPKTKKAQETYTHKLRPYRRILENVRPIYTFEQLGDSYHGFLRLNTDLRSSPEIIEAFLVCLWQNPFLSFWDSSQFRVEVEQFLDKESKRF
jgi:hypothetical protein